MRVQIQSLSETVHELKLFTSSGRGTSKEKSFNRDFYQEIEMGWIVIILGYLVIFIVNNWHICTRLEKLEEHNRQAVKAIRKCLK